MLWQVKNGQATYWIEASSNDEALASMISEYDPFQHAAWPLIVRFDRLATG